uniref:Uncharacterized protein n=1 Tax=Setaria italica TaxID=4555 RepID=K3YFE2_SETIT
MMRRTVVSLSLSETDLASCSSESPKFCKIYLSWIVWSWPHGSNKHVET